MSLLDEAKKVRPTRGRKSTITNEQVDLAVAWGVGEVELRQVATVLRNGDRNMSTYCFLATRLREAVRRGILVRKA